jgi:hypothetical protein
MHLDTRTIVIVATFVATVPTLISVSVWYTKQTCSGFARWTLGTVLGTLAMVFLSLRGVAPDWMSMVLSNTMAASAAVLYFQGVRQFCGLRLHRWPEYLAGGLTVLAVIYFKYIDNNIDYRIFAISLLMGSFGFVNGITLLRTAPAGRGFSTLFTGIVFILAGVAHLGRGAYLVIFTPGKDLFAPSAVNASFFAVASLGVVCWSFGFILMLGDRQSEEAKQSPLVPAAPGQSVTDAEVHEQVQRIILSEGFRRSARMERFLTLAVERTLLGHPEELKEYALGRDVFNRGEEYDPRADSIVRVEAQRLRRKLREYYDTCGKNDPIVVEFHAGSYVPTFRYATHIEMQLTMSKGSGAS